MFFCRPSLKGKPVQKVVGLRNGKDLVVLSTQKPGTGTGNTIHGTEASDGGCWPKEDIPRPRTFLRGNGFEGGAC